MSTELNKTIAKRVSLEVVLEKKNADELVALNYVWHAPGGLGDMNRDQTLYFWDQLLVSFPDMTITFDDAIAEGDKVALRYTTRGTHLAESAATMGMPATGKKIEIHGIIIRRIENGVCVEEWDKTDLFEMSQQLSGGH